MGVSRLEDLVAWQLAQAFKVEVYRLLREHAGASADTAFREQLRASTSSVPMNIGEGFYRYRAREFARFLSIALASLGEATLWLRDGVDRGHFPVRSCDEALNLAKRCRVATLRLRQKLEEMG
jgi:four helix bundle protein